jgi:hypothetical protein
MGTWIVVIVATTVLLGVAAVRSAGRRRAARMSTMDSARSAARQLGRESRARRGQRSGGTGDQFGRTKIKKYGDERHDTGDADTVGGSFDAGGGGAGGSD